MEKKYQVCLSTEERSQLNRIIASGKAPIRTIARANILLKTDSGQNGPGWTYRDICRAFRVSGPTISNTRKVYSEEGWVAAIYGHKSIRWYKLSMIGEDDANRLAIASIKASKDLIKWSLRLVQSRFIELGFIKNACYERDWSLLKINELEPLLKHKLTKGAESTLGEKELLSACSEPDSIRVRLEMYDNKNQDISNTRSLMTVNPERLERINFKEDRERITNRFIFFKLVGSKQYFEITDQRLRQEWAEDISDLLKVLYETENIAVVIENLGKNSMTALKKLSLLVDKI
ncbi:MAG: helix-turn-helix domain-containing protein [Anaerolineales bacterium]|nr:helix-turn-helix domain-containing protein [Anaerolineales bacterium]